jgi:hypothetical protein
MRTSTGGGPFIERRSDEHLLPETQDSAAWYDDFETFLKDAFVADLSEGISELRRSRDPELADIAAALEVRLEPLHRTIDGGEVLRFRELGDQIDSLVASRRIAADRIFNRSLNRLAAADRSFPAKLQEELARIDRLRTQDEADDEEAGLVFDEEDELDSPIGRTVSRDVAVRRYRAAIQALALSRVNRRSVSKSSRSGRLLDWLGTERLPNKDELQELGTLVLEQRLLRQFASIEPLLIRSITVKYRTFRRQRVEEARWYRSLPESSADVHWQEIDLLILATLRMAGRLLDGYRRATDLAAPSSGVLAAVQELYRAQILVDEATDFSQVQLSCMYELSHPLMRSFFLCGDVNQRLTQWGLRSSELLSWIDPRFEVKKITVSYRQSARLVDLAKSIALLDGSSAEDTVLPDRVDIAGVAPVWAENLTTYQEQAEWLARRISEIDKMVREATTIAVLVNSEQHVQPLADALSAHLEEISLAAVACRDGRDVGNDRDVRVFSVQHIKGLEFEGVFFVGLDETIEVLPELFGKYLYVGATRAATYLGITFSGEIPDLLSPLRSHFAEDWG